MKNVRSVLVRFVKFKGAAEYFGRLRGRKGCRIHGIPVVAVFRQPEQRSGNDVDTDVILSQKTDGKACYGCGCTKVVNDISAVTAPEFEESGSV